MSSLFNAFFKRGIMELTEQHIRSFNDFIDYRLQEIIDYVGEIPIETKQPFKVRFGKVEVGYPKVIEVDGSVRNTQNGGLPFTPLEARIRNLTYAAPIFLEVHEVRNEIASLSRKVHIGSLPIVVKSNRCLLAGKAPEELIALGEDPKDPGGYFIVNGSERVIVAFEDLAPNRILVDIDTKGTKPVYIAKVFSATVGFRARIQMKLKPDGTVSVLIPGVPTAIPFTILMKALGLEKDKDIVETVSSDPKIQGELNVALDQAEEIKTIEDAILYIGNKVAYGQARDYRIKRANAVLDNNLLPHIGRSPDKRYEKALFLGEMASRIIELKLGLRAVDDKDHYANKRLKLAGTLLSELFRRAFRSLCKDIKYQLERMSIRKPGTERISVAIRSGIITERLQHALATGNWGRGKVGITQLLDRTNLLSTLSHLRRVQSPLSRRQPNFEARELHPTHWGRLCPIETPEGSNCGLVKNLALLSSITVGLSNKQIDDLKELLINVGMVKFDLADIALHSEGVKVFLDGNLVGFVPNAQEFVTKVRSLRRAGKIPSEVNIALRVSGKKKEIIINCDEGRIQRPLIIVEDGKSRLIELHLKKIESGELNVESLIKEGIIEYLDADEEEDSYIALFPEHITPEHSHLELAPYFILGVCASVIPFAEHNQSPRNAYEAAMVKQALGINVINYSERFDPQFHYLHYSEVPIASTKSAKLIGYEARPMGQNCVVAILSYWGYNMEDAIILNKSSIERGFGVSTAYTVYEAECKPSLVGLKERFEIPEAGIRGYRGDRYYRLLEEDGIVSIGAIVDARDILIGRTSPPRFLEEYKEFEFRGPTRRDTSISMKPFEKGVVDQVILTETAQGNRLVKVRLRELRVPECGDKFASRHGQKGVVGLIVPQEDMPFTESGIVPDIIINPHAIPSRMTIGQFLESIAGKVAALDGKIVEASPFANAKKELRDLLLKLGFQHTGREVLYDGLTGCKYETDIFIGLVYYQKLHHMVIDKIHARSRGQVQMLTRQPTEGRARGGGLRFGEMERDSLVAHGASSLIKDRLLEESDKTVVYICERCGFLTYYDLRSRKHVCRLCGDKASISPVAMSYAFKLLLQELMSLCIMPKLRLSEYV